MKLSKQYYRLANGDKKVNCYHITITKEHVRASGIDEKAELSIRTKKGKIIIEQKSH